MSFCRRTALGAALAVGLAFAAPAIPFAADLPASIQTGETSVGVVLTDAKGMTLYIFDEDKSGETVCYAKCAKNWPPLRAAEGAQPMGAFTLVERKDGGHQWAKDGKPLYTWTKDKAPGDVTGDNFRDIWHVAKP